MNENRRDDTAPVTGPAADSRPAERSHGEDATARILGALRRRPVALSIRQPWAHRIIFEGKDIENRDWPTRFRGPVLIHAGKGVDADDRDDISPAMWRGGIVGAAEIVDCVSESTSRWFFGAYGFVLRNPIALEFIPCKGALGFFLPDVQPSVIRAVSLATESDALRSQPGVSAAPSAPEDGKDG